MNSTEQMVWSSLEQYDLRTRDARVARLIWLSQFQTAPSVVMGRPESLALLEQARACHVEGHFIAVVLTATACIEQTLMEELKFHNDKTGKGDFGLSIYAARNNSAVLIPTELLDDADKLRQTRNPFAHMKSDDQPHRWPNRAREQGKHPSDVLEADAEFAIETMYGFYLATIREVDLGEGP